MASWDDMRENPAPPVQFERAKKWAEFVKEMSYQAAEGETQHVVAVVEPVISRSPIEKWMGAYQVYMTEMPSLGLIPADPTRRQGKLGQQRNLMAAEVAARRVALELTKRGVSVMGGKSIRAWVFSSKSAALSYAAMLQNLTEATATLVAGVVKREFSGIDPDWHEDMFGHRGAVSFRDFVNTTGQGDQMSIGPGRIILRQWTGPLPEIARMAMRLRNAARQEWRDSRGEAYDLLVPLAIYRGKVHPSEPQVIRSILFNTYKEQVGAQEAKQMLKTLDRDIARGTYSRAEEYLVGPKGQKLTDAMLRREPYEMGGDFDLEPPNAFDFPGLLGVASLRP